MRFEYNPVIIRYQNKTETFASSGIHLVIKPEKSSKMPTIIIQLLMNSS